MGAHDMTFKVEEGSGCSMLAKIENKKERIKLMGLKGKNQTSNYRKNHCL
jgi:hypothetical protein